MENTTREAFSVAEVLAVIKSKRELSKDERARYASGIGRHIARLTKAGATARVSKLEAIKAAFQAVYPAGKRGRKAGAVDAELDNIDLSDLV